MGEAAAGASVRLVHEAQLCRSRASGAAPRYSDRA